MENEYNFEKVGKKMPFTMPEDFFNQMQANVLAEVAKEENEKKMAGQPAVGTLRKVMVKRIWLAAASIAACVCLVIGIGYSMMSSDGESEASAASSVNVASASEHSVDKAYDNLTVEEQQELHATYANDVYLCME